MKKITISICFVVALFVFPNAARAQFLVVDCSGMNPSAFATINAALSNVTGPGAFILITGTCNENVNLNGAINLGLAAPFGQTANINGHLSINNSQNVFLGGLNITNQFGDGIDVNSSRSVGLDSCSSSGNAGNGLSASGTSDIAIFPFGTFSNNAGVGISVGSNSLVQIFSGGGTTEISNNQNSALLLDRAVFVAFGGMHIAGNEQVAIVSAGAGRALIFSFSGLTPNVIENNPKGAVSLRENSEFSIGTFLPGAPNVITNNGPFGIEAGSGSQVTLFGVTISGHSGPGVDIFGHSQLLQFPGPNQILNNGTAGDPLSAGIRVDGNSEVLLRGINISQNNGPAILALVNSSADFAGSTFNGNTGVITCDSTSVMVSDLAASASNPASGVRCGVAHTVGKRLVNTPAPAVPDITAWKAMHSAYQQRSIAHK
jgi:hypothetical protein